MNKISVLAMALTLSMMVACGKKDDDKGSDKKKTNSELTNVTNTTTCVGPTPAGTNIYGNTWGLKYAANGVNTQVYFNFKNTQISVQKNCQGYGLQLAVQVRASAYVGGGTFQAFSNDEQEAVASGSDGQVFRCGYRLESMPQAGTYSFQGPCLQLTFPDGTSQLLPPAI